MLINHHNLQQYFILKTQKFPAHLVALPRKKLPRSIGQMLTPTSSWAQSMIKHVMTDQKNVTSMALLMEDGTMIMVFAHQGLRGVLASTGSKKTLTAAMDTKKMTFWLPWSVYIKLWSRQNCNPSIYIADCCPWDWPQPWNASRFWWLWSQLSLWLQW